MNQKRLGPLENPLRMTDKCISLICMSVIQQTVKIWAERGAGDLILLAMSNQRSFKIENFRFSAFVPKKIEYIRF